MKHRDSLLCSLERVYPDDLNLYTVELAPSNSQLFDTNRKQNKKVILLDT